MLKFLNCRSSFSAEEVNALSDIALSRNLDITLSDDINNNISVQVSTKDNRKFEMFKTFDSFASLYM